MLPLLMKTKKFQTQTYGKSFNKRLECLKERGVHKIFLIIRRGVYWREALKRGRAFIGGFTVNIKKMIKFTEFCKF